VSRYRAGDVRFRAASHLLNGRVKLASSVLPVEATHAASLVAIKGFVPGRGKVDKISKVLKIFLIPLDRLTCRSRKAD
jgi:hypothetical protein